MKWFRVGTGRCHAVNRSRGDQGREGQVVAWCGFGTVMPTWVASPDHPCRTCLRLS